MSLNLSKNSQTYTNKFISTPIMVLKMTKKFLTLKVIKIESRKVWNVGDGFDVNEIVNKTIDEAYVKPLKTHFLG